MTFWQSAEAMAVFPVQPVPAELDPPGHDTYTAALGHQADQLARLRSLPVMKELDFLRSYVNEPI